jgi:23S rRNA (uracil1939-C5)-methyltransferase
VPQAIADAEANAELNNITNAFFHVADIAKLLKSDFFIEANGKPDVVITDPPRAGMHPDVIESLLKLLPQKIVYVSCNPGTQARDLEMLSASYSVEKACPVDMFPHTHHLENVVLLRKK